MKDDNLLRGIVIVYISMSGNGYNRRSWKSVVEVGDPGITEVAPFFKNATGVNVSILCIYLDGHLEPCISKMKREIALKAIHLLNAKLRNLSLLHLLSRQ